MDYQIKTKEFRGPLELLLELIEKEKLDVTRFSLAQVADQYLEFIRNKRDISLAHLADFLVVASQIILIKSKALLPSLEISTEEENEIIDLEKRLLEYQRFQKVGRKLSDNFYQGKQFYSRSSIINHIKSSFIFPKELTAYQLEQDWKKVIIEIPIPEKLKQDTLEAIISLEDRIEEMKESLSRRIKTSFQSILSKKKSKVEVVVSFLAMLEMVKQQVIIVKQDDLFQDIKIELKT